MSLLGLGAGSDGAGGNSGKLHGGWQTAGVVFVADALGGWLVGQLADAGRKKLTELVLGSEQERALRRAADAAVWATAEEMSPSGGEQAGQVAMVISEVFRDPVPGAPLAGPVMLLEGLQAGIAGQLAVLDDAGLTGTGQSSADVLGVPGTVLADRLTGHLVREIIVRGSGGGPLTPLADQFNHELTRLQGQRIEGMLARLAGEVRDALARPDSGVTVAGRPLEEVTDPFVAGGAPAGAARGCAAGAAGPAALCAARARPGAGPGGARGGGRPQRDRGAGRRVLDGQDPGLLGGPGPAAGPGPAVAAVASDRPVPPGCGAAASCRASGRGPWCG